MKASLIMVPGPNPHLGLLLAQSTQATPWYTSFTTWCYLVGGVVALVSFIVLFRAVIGRSTHGRPRCSKCWYDMTGCATLVCPECGFEHDSKLAMLVTRRSRKKIIAAAMVFLLVPSAALYVPEVKWRMQVHHESFVSALVPTLGYAVLLPWLGEDSAAMIGSRGSAYKGWAFGLFGVDGEKPEYVPGEPLQYPYTGDGLLPWLHRWIIIQHAESILRNPDSDRNRRAWALELMQTMCHYVSPGVWSLFWSSRAEPGAQVGLDMEVLLLAMQDHDPFVQRKAMECLEFLIFSQRHETDDPAFRQAVVDLLVEHFNDKERVWYPHWPLARLLFERWRGDAIELAIPYYELGHRMTPRQLGWSADMVFYADGNPYEDFGNFGAESYVSHIEEIGPKAWRFFAWQYELAKAREKELGIEPDGDIPDDLSEYGCGPLDSIGVLWHLEACFKRYDSNFRHFYVPELAGPIGDACLAWLEEQAKDEADPYSGIKRTLGELTIARQLIRDGKPARVDEVSRLYFDQLSDLQED